MRAVAAILDFRNDLAIFDLDTSYQVFWSVGLSVQEKFKIDFHDGGSGVHLRFSTRTILAIFDL